MGNRIREHREKLGWSQVELGAKVGASHTAVAKHEVGERKLSVDWLQRYSKALGVSILALLTDDPTSKISVTHLINQHGEVVPMKPKFETALPDQMAIEFSEVFQSDTENLDMALLPGALIYCESVPFGSPFVGQLCVVTLRDGSRKLRLVKDSAIAGKFDLFWHKHKPAETAVELVAASRVKWIKVP